MTPRLFRLHISRNERSEPIDSQRLTEAELTRKYVIDNSRKGNRVSCKESGGLIPPEYMYIKEPRPIDKTLWDTLNASLMGAICRVASHRTVAAAVIVPPQKQPNIIPA